MLTRCSLLMLALMGLACMLLAGCGGDDGPAPVLSVSLEPDSAGVDLCAALSLEAEVAHGQASAVDWYVNGILGGNSAMGTISQANPATYTAPEVIPIPSAVTIKAVSGEDSTKADSCLVTIRLNVIHVSTASGSDATGTGCLAKPFKSITRGLTLGEPGDTVLVAPGVYDPANGEVFPMYLPEGVALVGQDRETTVIRKPFPQSDASVAVSFYNSGAVFSNFTLDEGHPDNAVWSHAIYVVAAGADAVIDHIIFPDRAYLSVIRITGTPGVAVTNCFFVVDDGETHSRGMEIISGDVGTIVRDCTFTGFTEGIFFNSTSNALVQGCTFDGNLYGVGTCCYNNDDNNPNPDFGGGARGSLGDNVFGSNPSCGLKNETRSTIYAKYNTWPHDPPVAGVDYCYSGIGGGIVVE